MESTTTQEEQMKTIDPDTCTTIAEFVDTQGYLGIADDPLGWGDGYTDDDVVTMLANMSVLLGVRVEDSRRVATGEGLYYAVVLGLPEAVVDEYRTAWERVAL